MSFFERAKKEVRALGVDVMLELDAKRDIGTKAAPALLGATMLASVVPAFANGGEDIAGLGTSIKTVITNIYSAAFPIVTVLAALMLVIAFIMRMTGSQQTAAKATSWIVRIIICYVLVNCIGLIFKVIENTTSSYKFNENG